MENDATFKKYLGLFECALADMYQAMDDILSSVNYEYKHGSLTLEQLAIITKMVYYVESIKPFEQ